MNSDTKLNKEKCMTFSQKAEPVVSTSSNDIPQEEWAVWAEHQWEAFSAKVQEVNGKSRKEKNLIGIVNYIQDLGTPPAKDSEWQSKCKDPVGDEEYSASEREWMAKNPTHDFIWTKQYNAKTKQSETVRKQTSPSYPMQEYGLAVDFPQVMLDYSKHPLWDGEGEAIRPLRISLNGSKKFFSPIAFGGNGKPIKENNLIYKICRAAGREKELLDGGFDIATVAGAECNFKVVADRKTGEDGGTIVYFKASTPSQIDDVEVGDMSITSEQQVEKAKEGKYIPEFLGVLFKSEGLSEDSLKYVAKDFYGYIDHASKSSRYTISGVSAKGEYSFEKGVDWVGSNLQKALQPYLDATPTQPTEPAQKVTPKKEPVVEEFVEPKVDLDFDDDVPF
jgi:hypothetical protein